MHKIEKLYIDTNNMIGRQKKRKETHVNGMRVYHSTK